MAFAHLPHQQTTIQTIQNTLKKNRLAHAYLIHATHTHTAQQLAQQITKTINCQNPPKKTPQGKPLDSCDQCPPCKQIQNNQHPDLTTLRPETKTRIITIQQIRTLLNTIHLKPHNAPYKTTIITDAERMNPQAANAFLKTLEEPPPQTLLLLTTTQPHRLLDTIRSRCQNINCQPPQTHTPDPTTHQWLQTLTPPTNQKNQPPTIQTRYHHLNNLLKNLTQKKQQIEQQLTNQSPLQQPIDIEPAVRERLKQQLNATIEAEYRRQRTQTIQHLHWYCRDIWLHTLTQQKNQPTNQTKPNQTKPPLHYPDLAPQTKQIANRLNPKTAQQNITLTDQLQQHLNTNIQETLALETTLLKLNL